MFKHIFESIAGIATWPVIALCLFFIIFIGMVIWVIKLDNSFVEKMAKLPLDRPAAGVKGGENEHE
jgi:hypothetical protein